MFGGTSAATTTASSSGFSFCQASGKNLQEIFPWLSSVYETFATSLHCFGNEKEVRENRRGSVKSVRGLGHWRPWAFLWSNHCGSSLASPQVLHQSANFMGEKNKFKVMASNE